MSKGIGSALLRNHEHMIQMISKIGNTYHKTNYLFQPVKSVPYPVSVKMRLHEQGVDQTIDIMKQLVEVGVVAFTIHGR